MDGLLFLLAVVALRFLWRFIEGAARQGEKAPPEVSEGTPPEGVPPEEFERRRAARERRRRAERMRTQQGAERDVQPVPAPGARRAKPDDLLERLRRAVEAASEMREPQSPPWEPPTAEPPPRTYVPPVAEPRASEPRSPALTRASVEPAEAEPPEGAVHGRVSQRAHELRALLQDHAAVRDALVLREILGPPVAHRRIPQALHKR